MNELTREQVQEWRELATQNPHARIGLSAIAILCDALLAAWDENDNLGSLIASEAVSLAAADARATRAEALIRRFRAWDDLPTRADGPYWMAEADRVLGEVSPS